MKINLKKSLSVFLLIFLFACDLHNEEKPNIVWLVAEDQSQYFFPFYGDKSILLPNISQLTENGVIYEEMHSTYPVCAPARSAIITGMYPNSIGTGNMRALRNDGKVLVRSEKESRLNIPYYSSKLAEDIKPFTQILRENGYYCSNNAKRDYNFILRDEAWDESSNAASWEKRRNDQPFFSVFNFGITHESSIWNRDKEPLVVDPNQLKVPPLFPDDSISRHSMAVNYSNLVEMDKQIGEIIKKLKDQGLYDNTYIFFYSDHGGPFPRHKRAIYETGTKVPLIVKFPQTIKPDKKRNSDLLNFIDFAPTILSIAGGIDIPKIYQGKAFLGNKKTENKRTFLFTASDRFDEHSDRIRAVRNFRYKYIKNYYVDKPHALQVSYRNQMALMQHLNKLNSTGLLNEKQQLWFQVPKKEEELYDLQKDPFELNNLIDDGNYSAELKTLKFQLNKWMNEINDLGYLSEKELVEYVTK